MNFLCNTCLFIAVHMLFERLWLNFKKFKINGDQTQSLSCTLRWAMPSDVASIKLLWSILIPNSHWGPIWHVSAQDCLHLLKKLRSSFLALTCLTGLSRWGSIYFKTIVYFPLTVKSSGFILKLINLDFYRERFSLFHCIE